MRKRGTSLFVYPRSYFFTMHESLSVLYDALISALILSNHNGCFKNNNFHQDGVVSEVACTNRDYGQLLYMLRIFMNSMCFESSRPCICICKDVCLYVCAMCMYDRCHFRMFTLLHERWLGLYHCPSTSSSQWQGSDGLTIFSRQRRRWSER